MFNLQQIGSTLEVIIHSAEKQFPFVVSIIGIIWVINFINWGLLGSRLNVLGIYPRSIFGLAGIVFSPILHGHLNHLFFNTIPLFLLINFILIQGISLFYTVTTAIMVISGLLVWLFARKAFHIGASSLIMGYWGYLLAQAFLYPSTFSIMVALVMLYYLGGLVFNLIPTDVKVSWEGHIFGAFAGVTTAFLLQYQLISPVWL